jgi:hypothetical protein
MVVRGESIGDLGKSRESRMGEACSLSGTALQAVQHGLKTRATVRGEVLEGT